MRQRFEQQRASLERVADALFELGELGVVVCGRPVQGPGLN
jgi:hypothetical protein